MKQRKLASTKDVAKAREFGCFAIGGSMGGGRLGGTRPSMRGGSRFADLAA